jgi:hypothetical protein
MLKINHHGNRPPVGPLVLASVVLLFMLVQGCATMRSRPRLLI